MISRFRKANVHILVAPQINPQDFRFIVNRIVCTEIHLFSSNPTIFLEWKQECDIMGILFHEHRLSEDQLKMLEDLYNVGEIVANRRVFLCLNSGEPLICNLIAQTITLELMHSLGSKDRTSTGACYQIVDNNRVVILPIYPYWIPDCRLVFEVLSTAGISLTKKQLLELIQDLDPIFSIDRLNRALMKLELALGNYEGFTKERKNSQAYEFEFNPLIEL